MDINAYLKEIHGIIGSCLEKDEIELRFGNFENKRFESNCNIETFNRVNTFVKSFGKKIWEGCQRVNIYSRVGTSQTKRSVCDIHSIENPEQISDVRFEIKKKKKTYDVNEYNLRFCSSSESVIKKPATNENIDFFMLRNRVVYSHLGDAFKIFMTYYRTGTCSELKFNIEIEVSKNISLDVFSPFIIEFLKAYNGCKILITNSF